MLSLVSWHESNISHGHLSYINIEGETFASEFQIITTVSLNKMKVEIHNYMILWKGAAFI